MLGQRHRFLARAIGAPGPARYRAIGVISALLAAGVFGVIAAQVVAAGRITVLDLELARWFHAHGTDGATRLMFFITDWHDTLGVSLMVLLFGAYLYAQRAHDWLLALVLVVPGGMLVNVLLKHGFHRVRPHFQTPLLTLESYSFPSGHTASAALLYGVLACYLLVRTREWGRRALVVAFAGAMIALVALSRIYLGAHYLSDVLAALAEAVCWLALCLTTLAALRRRLAARAIAAINVAG
jgi:membrane-associated phospholipid phosphatase